MAGTTAAAAEVEARDGVAAEAEDAAAARTRLYLGKRGKSESNLMSSTFKSCNFVRVFA
jgi:hypothetical protein